MTSRPASIRNVAWAVVRDGSASRHVYRRDVDLFLKDGRIVEITPAGAGPPQTSEPVLDGTGMLALPGLVNIHSHPTTEPGYRGVREDHGVPEQQMTGLIERLQAFRLGEDGRSAAAEMSYSEMLRAGTTTACDVTVPFDGWLETMVRSGMRFYAGPTFASARWGMAAQQTVIWKWDEAGGLKAFEKAKAVMAEAEAHNSGRLDAMVFPAQGLAMDHVGRYRARGVTVGLGTDCAPHNLIEEMRLAIVAGRLMSEDIASLDTGGAFEAATIGGAKALGRDDIGMLAAGMAADIVLVDLSHPLMQPARDPLRSFVFHAADRAVRTVLVNGGVVLQDGVPVHLDPTAAMERLAEAQARMLKDSVKHDYAGREAEQIAPLSLPIF